MSEKLGSAILELKTDSKKFDKGIGKAEKRTGKLEGKLKRASQGAVLLKTKLLAIGAAIVVGVGIMKAITRVTDLGDKIAKLSQKTGIATETLSSFRLVMNLGGASIDAFAKGMKTLSKMMFDVSTGAGAEAKKAFDSIDVATQNADGSLRDALDVFFDISEAFKKMEDGARKSAIAQTILGRAGLDMIPVLNMGTEAIKDQVKLAKELGLQFSELEGKQMEEFTDSVEVLNTAMFSLWQTLVIKITPALTKFTNVLLENIKATRDWESALKRFVRQGLFGLGKRVRLLTKDMKELLDAQKQLKEAEGFYNFTQGAPKGLAMPAGFDKLKEGAKETEAALVDMDKEIKLKGEDLADMADAGERSFDRLQNATMGWASNFSSTLTDMLFGAKSTFGSILKSFAKMLTQMAIQTQFVEPLLTGILSIGSNAPRGGITGPPKPGLFGLGVLGLAHGGIVKARPGGLLINVAEAGEDEVVAPLSKLERMGGNVEINIIGAPAGTRVEEGRTASGGRRIDVILDEQMANNIRPGTKTFKQLTKTFSGMSPTLLGR